MSTKQIGRLVGVLFLVQGAGGMLVNMVLQRPLFGAPGYLANAASHATQLGWSAVLGMVIAALSLAVAIAALPVFKRYSESIAIWILSLATARVALAAVEQIAVLSMVSVSQLYVQDGGAQSALFAALGPAVAAARNGSHYVNLMIGGVTLLLMYVILYRGALVPRWVAAVACVAIALQIATVTLPLIGTRIVMAMLAPMGLVHLLVSVWLAVRGFDERSPPRAPSLATQLGGNP